MGLFVLKLKYSAGEEWGIFWWGQGQTKVKVTLGLYLAVTDCIGLFTTHLEYRLGLEWGIFSWVQGQGHTNVKVTDVCFLLSNSMYGFICTKCPHTHPRTHTHIHRIIQTQSIRSFQCNQGPSPWNPSFQKRRRVISYIKQKYTNTWRKVQNLQFI